MCVCVQTVDINVRTYTHENIKSRPHAARKRVIAHWHAIVKSVNLCFGIFLM